MFGGIHQGNLLVLSFSLLWGILLLIQFHYSLFIYSDFQFIHNSILVGCMFFRIHPFLPSNLICWHIIVHSSLLGSFVLLWYRVWCLLSHFWFFWVFFPLVSLTRSLVIFSFQNISSQFHWSFQLFSWSPFISALVFVISFLLQS